MGKLLLLFTVPVLPFSLLTNYVYHSCERCRDLFVPFLVLVAVFLISLGSPEAGGFLKFLALLTSIVYTLRLVTLNELFEWLLYYYIAVMSLAWLNTEKMLFFIMAFSFPLIAINFLLLHLKSLFGTTHVRAIRGIAEVMPTFAFLTFISLISALAIAPAYSFFILYEVFETLNPLVAVLLLFEWVLWSWAGFKLFSGVLFGTPREDLPYEDISSQEAFPLFFLVLITFLLPLL